MIVRSQYDRRIRELETELRALRRKRKDELRGVVPKAIRPRMRKPPKDSPTMEQRRYWKTLAAMGCLICGAPAEIAHAHSGSIVERMQEPKAKGRKLRRYHWLALPLCPGHGREPYPDGLDTNVAAWEAKFKSQAWHIDRLIEVTGIDVWKLAQVAA